MQEDGAATYITNSLGNGKSAGLRFLFSRFRSFVKIAAGNVFWLLSAQIVSKISGIISAGILARLLGLEHFGEYAFTVTYVTFFAILAEFGTGSFVLRELPRNPEKIALYFWNLLALRIGLAFLTYCILLIILILFRSGYEQVLLAGIFGFTLFTTAFVGSAETVFNAMEEMSVTGQLRMLSNFLTVLSVTLAFAMRFTLTGAMLTLVMANLLVAVLAAFFFLRRRQLLRADFPLQAAFQKNALKESYPYAVLAVLGIIYFKIDTLMLSWYKGPAAVGVYSAAYRLLESGLVIPAIFSTALFPTMSRLHVSSRRELKNMYLLSTTLLTALGIVLAVMMYVFAPAIVRLVYGAEYAETVPVVRILSLALVLLFAHNSNGLVLFSGGLSMPKVISLSIFSAGSNVLMNIYAIPRFGYIGASVTTVISAILSLLIFTPFVFRLLHDEML